MEFWGLVVPSSKQVVGKASKKSYIHISHAALADVKIPSENERVVLRVKVKDNDFVLGTLIPGKCDQLNMDAIYDAPFIVYHTSKSCSVHLTGYTTVAGEEEESEEEEEELAVAKPKLQNGGVQKVWKVSGMQSDDDSESSDDDDDDDDDDESDSSDEDEDEKKPVVALTLPPVDDDNDDDDDDDDEEDDEDDDDDDDDDEDDDDDYESDEDDEEVPKMELVPVNHKRKNVAPSPSQPEKKIKTPSGKAVKPDVKADGKPDGKADEKPGMKTPTPKTPKQDERKSDKKAVKNTPKSTPKSTDSKKTQGSPGLNLKCDTCKRNFNNESALIQHNTAKHQKN